MGEVTENNSDMSVLQRIATSGMPLLKDYGLNGVVGAVLLAIVIPLLLTSMFGKKTKKRAVQADVGGEAGLAMRNSRFSSLVQVPWEGATTMAALFEMASKKYSLRRSLGTRKLINKEFVESSDGRKFEKLHLGEYQWDTYAEAFNRACNFASGLIKMGHKLDSHAAIFSDTRAEWIIAAQVITSHHACYYIRTFTKSCNSSLTTVLSFFFLGMLSTKFDGCNNICFSW